MNRSLRAGIVGCGVAGLACGVLLGRQGYRVTIIERAPKFAPIGAGLILQPSGQKALGRMGVLEEVMADAEPLEGIHAFTHRGRTLVELWYRKIDPILCGYGVHRDDLFGVLYGHCLAGGVEFRLGVTVVASRQSESEILAIDEKGGEHGPFDVLIGADGSRSRIRGAPELGARVRELALGAAWFSGHSDAVRGYLHQVTRGTRQLIGLLPLGRGRCSLFCSLPREGLNAANFAALKREIVELCPQASPLVEQIESDKSLATAKYQLVSLRKWNHGRLICIGDAAHSTTPHLGQGVNLALLDALAVATELATGDDVPTALARAAEFRRRQTMWCWRLSNLLGPAFQNEGRMLGAARDVVLPWMPAMPWLGKTMVATLAGVRTGIRSGLKVEREC
jgi:2-polyprenyl-6-methoxyphenol hydroxylase-like FAD-dependent oxidoreductase